MPAFPRGRPRPGYPRVGGSGESKSGDGLEPVTSAKSWYALWTSRALGVSPHDGGRLARLLLERLAHDGVLTAYHAASPRPRSTPSRRPASSSPRPPSRT